MSNSIISGKHLLLLPFLIFLHVKVLAPQILNINYHTFILFRQGYESVSLTLLP